MKNKSVFVEYRIISIQPSSPANGDLNVEIEVQTPNARPWRRVLHVGDTLRTTVGTLDEAEY